jgi:hypothetical protein
VLQLTTDRQGNIRDGLCVGSRRNLVFGMEAGPAVVFDTDVDFDDTVALAALAQKHIDGRIDLRAVTITNNGGGLPGQGADTAFFERTLIDVLNGEALHAQQ